MAKLQHALVDGADATPRAAAALRRLLRTDAAARRAAFEALLHGQLEATQRAALALVLGTLPGPDIDPVLLAAARRFSSEPFVLAHVLHALGATREPAEDDDVFDLGDRPWGIEGPGGLGISVLRRIEDPAVIAQIGRHLAAAPEPAVRLAAATALRHSIDDVRARQDVFAALGHEPSDAVSSVLGEALASWAGRGSVPSATAEERRAIVGRLLARAETPDFDAYRFQIENDFDRIPVDPHQVAELRGRVGPNRPFAIRSWALTVLVRCRKGADAAQAMHALLPALIERDRDPAMRDLAARLVRRLPVRASTLDALERAARSDAAWNVRFTALQTLAQAAPRQRVLHLSRVAARDPDPRVVQLARQIRAASPAPR